MTLRTHVFKQRKGSLLLGGFSLISAIFLLLVLAALGAAIANISMMQHTESALDIQGARAYQAARAGVEWGVYQVEATPAYNFGRASANPNVRACPASPSSFQFPVAASTFSGYTVTVTCNAINYANANPPITVFQIVSTACNQPVSGACPGTSGGTYYVERQLSVKL
ncbi:MAG TPA: agglutinin biogenesis protein MshP [Noviherbaspirillum sp.]|nr:agglutinin biogenesis protein MshP [Noviherbaspirillum sp.]